ncbi:tyrosine-protein kinase family protein [Yeosuana marina]|uniref:tyrosine-protein kinase family protein n=1 Tax=Yeosuana marina TaxID=1565536 RepID=UPI00141DB5F1|nr:CpsD/CapB family tyrosine-protein kinase [Yeosuana marina]
MFNLNAILGAASKFDSNQSLIKRFIINQKKYLLQYLLMGLIIIACYILAIIKSEYYYIYFKEFQLIPNVANNANKSYLTNQFIFEDENFSDIKSTNLIEKVLYQNNLFIECYSKTFSFSGRHPENRNSYYKISINKNAYQLINVPIYLKEISKDSVNVEIKFDKDRIALNNYSEQKLRYIRAVNDTSFNIKLGEKFTNNYMDLVINRSSGDSVSNFFFEMKSLKDLSMNLNRNIELSSEKGYIKLSVLGFHRDNLVEFSNKLVLDYVEHKKSKIKKELIDEKGRLFRFNILLNDSLTHYKSNSNYIQNINKPLLKGIEELISKNKITQFQLEEMSKGDFFYLEKISDRISERRNDFDYEYLFLILFLFSVLIINVTAYLLRMFDLKSLAEIREIIGNRKHFLISSLKRREHPIKSRDTGSRFSAELDSISSYLIYNKDKPQYILIDSSQSGDGKSFVTLNLALSLARIGKRVIVIGGNRKTVYNKEIPQPKLGDILNIGLGEYLVDKNISLREAINTYEVNGIQVDMMHWSKIPPSHILIKLIHSKRFKKMLAKIKKQYDFLLFDSSLFNVDFELEFLRKSSDLILYIIRLDYTRFGYLKLKLNDPDLKDKPILFVINDVKKKESKLREDV